MSLADILIKVIAQALMLLPSAMDSREARVLLLAIGWQESRFVHRRQIKGPARGFWQFERGSKTAGGGVWGVYLHPASRYWLAVLCEARGCEFHPDAIYRAIEHDDILAAGLARLLLFTDPKPLPAVHDVEGAWVLYAKRTWLPGKPHRDTWDQAHKLARETVRV
nr:hypothetical protein [uncultured Roseateles sp.]